MPGVEVPLVQLDKVDASRLNLEAENYAWRTKHKQAAAERHSWQTQERQKGYEQRAAMAEKGRETVRSGMQRSIESNHQQNASVVLSQRQRFREIARRRDELRSQHAAQGKRLHGEKFGAQASAQRSRLQADKADQRKQLGRYLAELEAQHASEQAEGAARRSASAVRVRAQAGFHIVHGAFDESHRQRNADAQVKRRQSQAWAEASRQQRTLTTPTAMSTMSFAAHERRKDEVEALKRFVPDFQQLRAHLREDLERKKREAAEVRSANQSVEDEAKAVLLHSARRRKAVHDWVIRDKVTELPQPQVSAGAGGIAGSRKASVAASFAARSSLQQSKTILMATPRADHQSAGIKFFSHAHTFETGPLGITLGESAAGVVVQAVEKGSAAANLGVPVGGVLLAVNAQPLVRLIKSDVQRALAKANWPMALQIAPCLQFLFQDRGPIGLTVQDTQNGVAVWKVAEDSKAHLQGVPVGSLVVAVAAGHEAPIPTAGLGRAEIGAFLLQRPLMVQVVPRDAAYLFRPKGVYVWGTRKRDDDIAGTWDSFTPPPPVAA